MRDRSEDGFDAFFRSQYQALLGVALAMVGDVSTAQDVVQEALLRVLRDWRRVSGLERADLWARRVMMNLAIDVRRRRVRQARHSHRQTWSEEDTSAGSHVEASGLWDAVRALPDRQRAAVVLRYVEDLSISDIARVLNVTDGTIKATLAHARVSLARRLGAETIPNG